MFKGRRILIEKGDDGHARVVVLYRQVAQSDELLDYVSLESKSSFLHISYNVYSVYRGEQIIRYSNNIQILFE